MYLTKLGLDIRHPSARQALRDVQDMHRNLMAGFGNCDTAAPRSDMSILYRLIESKDRIVLLVSSAEYPDCQALRARGFIVSDAQVRDISPLRNVLVEGRRLRFELLASPCKKIMGEAKNSRRALLETEDERMAWLERKAAQYGFELLTAMEISQRIDMRGQRGGSDIKNSGVLFSGVLRITDAEAFWEGYTRGIGPGKAYGLGMLNIARA